MAGHEIDDRANKVDKAVGLISRVFDPILANEMVLAVALYGDLGIEKILQRVDLNQIESIQAFGSKANEITILLITMTAEVLEIQVPTT